LTWIVLDDRHTDDLISKNIVKNICIFILWLIIAISLYSMEDDRQRKIPTRRFPLLSWSKTVQHRALWISDSIVNVTKYQTIDIHSNPIHNSK
jgi:anaerobic C4-dicarboxylate transporter